MRAPLHAWQDQSRTCRLLLDACALKLMVMCERSGGSASSMLLSTMVLPTPTLPTCAGGGQVSSSAGGGEACPH
jgi:hypothetical protein